MRQIVQYAGSGKISVIDSPEPMMVRHRVKIRTMHSLISAGTERTKVEMGEKSLIGKARARPDLVAKVVAKAKKEGLWSTFTTVRNRLAEATPLGYSLAGIVEEVGPEAEGVRPGDFVAAAGAGFANHADYVVVPHTLVAPLPDGVDTQSGAFATIGAIALQGIRQAQPQIGETFLVIGLGLIGQITAQILQANGCRVLAYDLVDDLVERAIRSGAIGISSAEDVVSTVLAMTDGYGVDGVIITASSESNEPVALAGEVTREKGRVVVVGAVSLNLPREPYYMKEIDFRFSRSYGPGRYDFQHEEGGQDYPFGYVRFTEGRNMRAFLDLVAQKRVDVAGLITHTLDIDDAPRAYDLLSNKTPCLGILLSYPVDVRKNKIAIVTPVPRSRFLESEVSISFVGAGNYATSKLIPALKRAGGVRFNYVCTASGRSASDIANRFDFAGVADTPEDVFATSTDAVFIVSRHSSHATLAEASLRAEKHTFVEKPLCVTTAELETLVDAYSAANVQLMVGLNRRFSPMVQDILRYFGPSIVQTVTIRVNAGPLPSGHWSLDATEGGRVLGEISHFIDLAVALTGSMPASVYAVAALGPGISAATAQTSHIQLVMRNGALVSIIYFPDGSPALFKERIECHGGGKSAVIDDFRELSLYGAGSRQLRKGAQDKGQDAMIVAFLSSVKTGRPAISPSSLFSVSEATLAIVESARRGQPVDITNYDYLDHSHAS